MAGKKTENQADKFLVLHSTDWSYFQVQGKAINVVLSIPEVGKSFLPIFSNEEEARFYYPEAEIVPLTKRVSDMVGISANKSPENAHVSDNPDNVPENQPDSDNVGHVPTMSDNVSGNSPESGKNATVSDHERPSSTMTRKKAGKSGKSRPSPTMKPAAKRKPAGKPKPKAKK